ncbi:MAG: tyrosine-type recombinase/integrase [Clostridiales bacterium]|jgi:integrase/recombinase XerC|nr:tyrosine-type recombinase/integrase [Clostridiales bacterium]
MSDFNYHEQLNIKNTKKLRDLLAELPRFCGDFFRGVEPTTSAKTRIAYAYDLKVFFEFITNTNPAYKNFSIRDLKIDILDQITALDLEEFLEYLTYYKSEVKEYINSATGKKRKLTTIRSFYNYYYRKEMIETNPAVLVDIPKVNTKEIIRLDPDEVARLLDEVDSGENLTEKQKAFHNKTRTRDLAIITLLLGTGLRVSECVGLDIDDVDFNNDGVKIVRKGGNEAIIYFGDEVRDALENYLLEREDIITQDGHEDALFLSLQRRRISVRAVENLVKKYASLITSLKNITPHKLRSTYGTSLYRATGDIYLVADVLGHSDVNTTKKHYAAIEDARRRSAANKVKLRED